MKIPLLLGSLFCLFNLSGLAHAQTHPADAEEITQTLENFYGHPQMPEQEKYALTSQTLNALLAEADAETRKSGEIIDKSDSPSDKPKMLDYDIFQSQGYDGYTGFALQHLRILEDWALADMEFVNSHDDMKWRNTVVLLRENGAWKVHDVYLESSRESLRQFIAEPFIPAQEGQDVQQAIDTFYEQIKNGNLSQTLPLVSKDLAALLQKAQQSGPLPENLLTGGHPDYQTVALQYLTTDGESYQAKILFRDADPWQEWEHTTLLVQEDGQWKVDDIHFEAGGWLKAFLKRIHPPRRLRQYEKN